MKINVLINIVQYLLLTDGTKQFIQFVVTGKESIKNMIP